MEKSDGKIRKIDLEPEDINKKIFILSIRCSKLRIPGTSLRRNIMISNTTIARPKSPSAWSPADRSSSPRTDCPSRIRRLTYDEPRKPAAPVMRNRMDCINFYKTRYEEYSVGLVEALQLRT